MAWGSAATNTLYGKVSARPVPRLDPVAWACEAVGTLAMLIVGFSSIAIVNAQHSPLRSQVPSASLRYALIGLAFGLSVAAVVASPLGRRSGAHLNPAVTFALWLRGMTSGRNAVGYVAAQCVGATAAAGAFAAVWGPWSTDVYGAREVPAQGISPLVAAGIELLLTLGLVVAVLLLVDAPSMARWTPSVIAVVIAMLVWAGAATSGASFNPARALGPALVRWDFSALWLYIIGPLAGSALATALCARHGTAASAPQQPIRSTASRTQATAPTTTGPALYGFTG